MQINQTGICSPLQFFLSMTRIIGIKDLGSLACIHFCLGNKFMRKKYLQQLKSIIGMMDRINWTKLKTFKRLTLIKEIQSQGIWLLWKDLTNYLDL